MRHTTDHQRRTVSILLIAGALTTLAGCGGGDEAEPVAAAESAAESTATDGVGGTDPAAAATYGLVSADEAAALAELSNITVIDVRTPEEYAEGHIDGAQLIDFYSDTFGDDIAALDPDGEFLVYCRSGNRSGQAVGLMRELGFDRVYDLDGGVVAYAQAGLRSSAEPSLHRRGLAQRAERATETAWRSCPSTDHLPSTVAITGTSM